MNTQIQDFSEQYRRRAAALPGAGDPAIAALREEALARFAGQGLPHRSIEDWKWSDLSRALARPPAPLAAEEQAGAQYDPAALFGPLAEVPAARLVFVDGFFDPGLSGPAPEGVEVIPLDRALSPERDILFGPEAEEAQPVLALNRALMGGGVLIKVAPGAEVKQPVHLAFFASGRRACAAYARNAVVLGRGAKLDLFESWTGAGRGGFSNAVTRAILEEGAALGHLRIEAEGPGAVHVSTFSARLSASASYRGAQIALAGLEKGREKERGCFARLQSFFRFAGQKAEAQLAGVILAGGSGHCDLTARTDHDAPGCASDVAARSVLAGAARGVFQSSARVHPGAQNSDVRQMSRALLLSAAARMHARPELAIHNDNVQCAHGSAIGSLDPQALFYLRQRGLDPAAARALLLEGFAAESLARIPQPAARAALLARAPQLLAALAASANDASHV